MDCREARELLPLLHRQDGLPAGEAKAVQAHVAGCPGCRGRNKEVREAVESLRAGLADLDADPPGEEEMMEMLADLKSETRRSRLVPIAAAAAVILVAGGIIAFLIGGGEKGLFDEGPQVADWEGVKVEPPPLRVPRSRAFDAERRRILVTVRDGVYQMRLSYEPEDGKKRVRTLDSGKFARAPAPKGGGDRPVLLLAADPETPWREVWRAWRMFEPIEVYIAGREPKGTLGALPLFTGPAVEEILRMGATVTPRDMAAGAPPRGAIELRVTRENGSTRYRFGVSPFARDKAPRFGLGDERMPDSELSGAQGEPVPRSLREHIDGLEPEHREHRGIVFLQVGSGVRYVDVLRAVECAGGNEWFYFTVQYPVARDLDAQRLPAPLTKEDATALVEDFPETRRTVVNVDEQGRLKLKGIVRGLELIDSAAGTEILLRADVRAPWDACAKALARARAAGKTVLIAFAPGDPSIGWERVLALPSPAEGVQVFPIHVTQGGIVPNQDPAAAAKVIAPDGATAGEVVPKLLRWTRMGMKVFVFE